MKWIIEVEQAGGAWMRLAECTTIDACLAVVAALCGPKIGNPPVFKVTRIDPAL